MNPESFGSKRESPFTGHCVLESTGCDRSRSDLCFCVLDIGISQRQDYVKAVNHAAWRSLFPVQSVLLKVAVLFRRSKQQELWTSLYRTASTRLSGECCAQRPTP